MRSFLLFAILLVAWFPLSAFAEDLTACRKGWDFTQSGDYPNALAQYEACIKNGGLSPASLARTYRNIGITQRRVGKPLEAVASYDKAINLKPSDMVDDYINRGNAYDEANRFDEALLDYAKALQISPGYGEAYYNRGIAYENHHMLKEARDDFVSAYKHGLRTELLFERLQVYGLLKLKKDANGT